MNAWLEYSPVTTNLIHTSGSILTPMFDTIVDIYTAVQTRPTTWTDAGVGIGIIQYTDTSIGTGLMKKKNSVTRVVKSEMHFDAAFYCIYSVNIA